jgi:hypothetical protein
VRLRQINNEGVKSDRLNRITKATRGQILVALLMPRLVLTLALVVSLITTASTQTVHSWGAPLEPIFEALGMSKTSVFVELTGRCVPVPDFPPLRFPALAGEAPVQALREVASYDPAMRVKAGRNGTIQMKEKRVSNDLLKVRLARLVFEDSARNGIYTANVALQIIMRSPEVVSFMEAHHIAPWPTGGGIGGSDQGHWPPGSPHVSGSVNNVTVAEALEHVLRAFPGEVLVYWDCPAGGGAPRRTSAPLNQVRLAPPNFFRACQAESAVEQASSPLVGSELPDILCMPPSAFSNIVLLLPEELWVSQGPEQQRKIVIRFFAMKRLTDGKMLIHDG